jgi:anti-anti-sigma factor
LAQQFCLTTCRDGATLRLSLIGEFDRSAVDQVERALAATWDVPTDEIVVDLSDVTFLDAAGLRALLVARKQAKQGQMSMSIVRPRGHVNRIFTLTPAGEVLSLVDDVPPSSP